MTKLNDLVAESNGITDLSPLAGLSLLDTILLRNNRIKDISPLANLTNLDFLYIGDNFIEDLSPLAGLYKMRALSLHGNLISDVSPLAGLTNLDYLGLGQNRVYDISPLQHLPNLTLLGLESMYIFLPEQSISRSPLQVSNPLRNLDGSLISSLSVQDSSYSQPFERIDVTASTVSWHFFPHLSRQQNGTAYYRFEQEVQIGGATATFSGYVYQPYVYTPLTPGDSSLPALWGGVIITSSLAVLLLIFFKSKLR